MRVLDNGCAYWSLGSIVEVGLHTEDHDPNHYRARCLTGGTFPLLQVLDDKYPEPMQCAAVDTPIVIWKEIAESAEAEEEAFEQAEEQLNGVQEEVGMFIIIGCKKGHVRVGRKGEEDPVVEGLDSVEEARDWIARNECDSCGHLKTDAAGEGCTERHIGAPAEFAF